MSWDADLLLGQEDDAGSLGGWNYTANTNGMIHAALDYPDVHWCDRLHGMNGAEGAAFLTAIVAALESDPTRFRKMNPPNGWGDFDSLVRVLSEMRDAALTERPAIWQVCR